MFKKLTLAGIALLASTGIAFADTDPAAMSTDNSAASTTSEASSTEATAASTTPATPAKHKKHKHKKHHKKHHHHYQSSTSAADAAPVADPAPAGGYKGEVAAAPCPACVHNVFNTGAYVGLSVGSRVNVVSRPIAWTGVEGTLFAGYSMLWDQVYGALEILVQDDAEVNNYRSRVYGSAASSWGYGLSVIPGYLINDDVLGYLRLGVVSTRYTTPNQNRTGGQVGLGMQTALTPCWDLRGEWIYTWYNSATFGVPRSQSFNLGLLYKFQI